VVPAACSSTSRRSFIKAFSPAGAGELLASRRWTSRGAGRRASRRGAARRRVRFGNIAKEFGEVVDSSVELVVESLEVNGVRSGYWEWV
jgi:hypothetical protein